MDGDSNEVSLIESANEKENAESDLNEDNEIFHDCAHNIEDVNETNKDNLKYIAQEIGNLNIIEDEKKSDSEPCSASTELPVSDDLTSKDGSLPRNMSSSRNSIRYCDICEESDKKITANAYCLICDEYYCNDCTKVHRSQKATKEHEVGPPKSRETVFVCETCKHMGIKIHAKASCKDCKELYCDTCSTVHKRQKATKTHTVSTHDSLSERGTCEPCRENGTTEKAAYHICLDCDEVQCFDCFSVHIKQKATREHIVIYSEDTDQNYCILCDKAGKYILSNMYCRACSIKLCNECSVKHREEALTRDHKVIDIPTFIPDEYGRRKETEVIPADKQIKCYNIQDDLKPGIPCIVDRVKLDYVCLAWEPPKQVLKNMNYQLRYKETSSDSIWVLSTCVTAKPTITLVNLKSNTRYVFQVRMVSDEEVGPYSGSSDIVETIQSAASRLLDFMYEVKRDDVEMPLKRLPVQENKKVRDLTGKTRKLIVGKTNRTNANERTVMLVGATGTGKSTLVDGMINYILGVNWSDPYRLTLVDLEEEELNRDNNQAVSQTQWITCYTINPLQGSRLDFTLNIVDTPGFGDTRGVDRDKEIIDQIRSTFSKEDESGIVFIDAVCFLVKAPDARLTSTQMYIFNAIMSLFGQDIKDNFCMLMTFADGKKPPVLAALKEAKLPHEQYFPFNNSGLFAENSGEGVSNFSSMFWEMGCESFRQFFEKLKTMNTKSLQLTRNVLEQRELIELNMENLLPKLDAGLNKVEEILLEIQILEDFKTQIEENSNFVYTVKETEQKQIDLPIGQHVTNCLNCHVTCHKDCKIPNDEDKRRCKAMDCDGFCTQCPMNCFWDSHRNTPYIFEYITVQKEKTYTEKLEKYRQAKDENMTRQKVVERMHEELYTLEQEILNLMGKINHCNNILREIALRPDPLSLVDHIDLLIESEKLEKRAGFQGRISSLMQCRKKATIEDDVQRFTTCLTDTKKIYTAQVIFTQEAKKQKKKKGKHGIFQSIVNYF